jgi:hypothetical protein
MMEATDDKESGTQTTIWDFGLVYESELLCHIMARGKKK